MRTTALVLLAAAGLVAAGCGGSSSASGTSAPPSGAPSSATPANTLTGALLPLPPGFVVSTGAGARNGSLDAAGFDSMIGTGASSKLRFHDGAEATYENGSTGYSLELDLFRFDDDAGAGDFATTVEQGVVKETSPAPTVAGINGITDGISISATGASSDGTANYGVIAVHGVIVMVVDYTASFATANRDYVQAVARLQYARVPSR